MSPSKSDEIKLYRDFVAGLPDGYLRDTFEGTENEVEAAIRNDVCLPGIASLRQQREDLALEVKALAKRRDELKTEVVALERSADRIGEGIKGLRLDAEKIARSALSYASYASDMLKRA
jgi:hypothetical protein